MARFQWAKPLKRWQEAGLLTDEQADRIRAYEAEYSTRSRFRWPVIAACSLGGLMLAAGVLLFVAAHWEDLSPWGRLSAVLCSVVFFHVAGALLPPRYRAFSISLHAVGTATLGGGIFLTGQIFHLQEYWPSGFLLWALGAWLGWAILRDWVQLIGAALLTPVWIFGEWQSALDLYGGWHPAGLQGLVLLAVVYFSAMDRNRGGRLRAALTWMGGLVLLPSTLFLIGLSYTNRTAEGIPAQVLAAGWVVGLGLPLGLAYFMHGRAFWPALVAAVWVSLLALNFSGVTPYVLSAGFCFFIIWWGFRDNRKERINMGAAGFVLTLIFFYFSNVFDKLGRSLSLISLGTLLLLLGWAWFRFQGRLKDRLERTHQ